MREFRFDEVARDEWATNTAEELLQGGASFSEWATLMSYEAHTCFVSGADIATIVLCACSCETFLRTEEKDFNVNFYTLIEQSFLESDLTENLHDLRKARNNWVHGLVAKGERDLSCYTTAYDFGLESDAKNAYRTMLHLFFSNPFI